ncbi:iron ABC transporter ATP-binding protein [Gallibacterium salpingitidis]|uniref:Iron ABC transporter ATP-binding protein n=1 Tax=Gallibacterium salpingitidis TaxID=505341 RepID=A0AB36E5N2_9PAST|nr:ABC transporter ATP-binding protein [Gallibacterium salpingitidis]OBX09942.1 iron ABC transporter ATP-binding protein [Gallibacterium salpingitidis]OBX12000.1 iron ABC transporter ATP-binding protein [Gallibacterium salpingitidis]WKS99872.1 ABC transporter ATP-binding protein [Gallibacterium salpingitidis]
MSYIQLNHVMKQFGDVIAIPDLNLSIEKGECFSMLGPSGCGKTTTLRMIAGFEDLDGGEIRVGERLLSSKATNFYLPPEKRNFGMVFQAFAVWPHMSVYDNVAFPLALKNLSKQEIEKRTTDALKHTNLLSVAKKSPDDLSGGGKQRVALARALALNPDVMLLDEPLSSLDPHLREEMRFEIKALQRKFGFSIIYVTHDQSEAMALSDRILVMKKGVIEQIDTPLNVYNNPANKFVFSFIGLSNQLKVNVSAQGVSFDGCDGQFMINPTPPAELIQQGKAILATRPSEIDFVSQGGIPGVVKRRSYLGEVIDYSILIGNQELRIQKGRRDHGPQEGEMCQVVFSRLHWYPVE